jgi:acetylcholinesterase
MTWGPVVEPDFGQERFLIEEPNKLFREGKFMKVNAMVGITTDEFISPIAGMSLKLTVSLKKF